MSLKLAPSQAEAQLGTSTGGYTRSGNKGNIAFEEIVTGDSDTRMGDNTKLERSVIMLQNFMIQKGLMSKEELDQFMKEDVPDVPEARKQNASQKRVLRQVSQVRQCKQSLKG